MAIFIFVNFIYNDVWRVFILTFGSLDEFHLIVWNEKCTIEYVGIFLNITSQLLIKYKNCKLLSLYSCDLMDVKFNHFN